MSIGKKKPNQNSGLDIKVFGSVSNPAVLVFQAMGASMTEWIPFAERLSEKFHVVLFDRPGYGRSSPEKGPLTPESIVKYALKVLELADIDGPVILIGHSIGGIFAREFSLSHPERTRGLVLADPMTPLDAEFKKRLSPRVYKKSGVDKSLNLHLGFWLCTLGLGSLFKPLLRKAPPFFYYSFDLPLEREILQHSTRASTYRAAISEYAGAKDPKILRRFLESPKPGCPIALVTHGSEGMVHDIMEYGGASLAEACEIECLWQSFFEESIAGAEIFRKWQSENGAHPLHLTDPEILKKSLNWVIDSARA